MVDIGWDDCPARCNFITDKFRRHVIGNIRAPVIAVTGLWYGFTQLVFANSDEFHFGRDDARTCIGQLGHRIAGFRAQGARFYRKFRDQVIALDNPVIRRFDITALVFLDISTGHDPVAPQQCDALPDIDQDVGVGIGP